MFVKIIKVHDNDVAVSTPYGSFCGRWCDAAVPQSLRVYDVELDTDDIIDDTAVCNAKINEPSILCDEDKVQLTGLLERYENCMLFVRLGESLIMLETDAEFDASRYVGEYICIRVSGLQLWNTGLPAQFIAKI